MAFPQKLPPITIKREYLENYKTTNLDLDTQFIIRLPVETGRTLRAIIHAGVSLKDRLFLDVCKDLRHVVFQFDNWIYCGKIYDMPTVIESLKTVDGKLFFKTADISQICVCKSKEFSSSDEESPSNPPSKEDKKKILKKYLYPHGLTPPLKNARKHRFRKTLPKEFVDLSEIEQEVRTLLRADNDAVSVKWEVVYEDELVQSCNKKELESVGIEDLFGEEISDDNDCTPTHTEKIIKNGSSSSDEKIIIENEDSRSSLVDYKVEEASVDEEVFILRNDLVKLENQKQQLIWKINGIENYALKERLIETLKNFEKEIENKKAHFKNFKE